MLEDLKEIAAIKLRFYGISMTLTNFFFIFHKDNKESYIGTLQETFDEKCYNWILLELLIPLHSSWGGGRTCITTLIKSWWFSLNVILFSKNTMALTVSRVTGLKGILRVIARQACRFEGRIGLSYWIPI